MRFRRDRDRRGAAADGLRAVVGAAGGQAEAAALAEAGPRGPGEAAMKHRVFLSKLEHESIVKAIGAAELRTSGEIRVYVARGAVPEALRAAQKHFGQLGMHKTKERNGVLIFVAPKSQTFAIWGDAGVHEKCGEGFWKVLSEEMTGHLKRGEFTEAITHAIGKAGGLLAEHFPRRPGDKNELPDTVIEE